MPMVRAGGFLTGKIWGAGAVLLRITRTLPGVNKPTPKQWLYKSIFAGWAGTRAFSIFLDRAPGFL